MWDKNIIDSSYKYVFVLFRYYIFICVLNIDMIDTRTIKYTIQLLWLKNSVYILIWNYYMTKNVLAYKPHCKYDYILLLHFQSTFKNSSYYFTCSYLTRYEVICQNFFGHNVHLMQYVSIEFTNHYSCTYLISFLWMSYCHMYLCTEYIYTNTLIH